MNFVSEWSYKLCACCVYAQQTLALWAGSSPPKASSNGLADPR